MCITCYARVDGEYYCHGCSWQCCGEQCECGARDEVTRAQCAVLAERNVFAEWSSVEEATLSMDFLGPHRLLLAIQQQPGLRHLLSLDMQNQVELQTKVHTFVITEKAPTRSFS